MVLGCTSSLPIEPSNEDKEDNGDSFILSIQVQIQDDSSAGASTVWVPVPGNDGVQEVELLASPVGSKLSLPDEYGNRFASLTDWKGQLVEWKYRIDRRVDAGGLLQGVPASHYLSANRLVPIGGEAAARAKEVVASKQDASVARAIYNRVLEDMCYDKRGFGWGTGSTEWACATGYGNCTDFHALFISMARSLKIPARFTIGFPIPTDGSGEIDGYHCWAHYWDGQGGWVPVDISEADQHPERTEFFFGTLDPNRVSLSYGRDLILDPPQEGDPLNYFVNAYAEQYGLPLGVKTSVYYQH